MQRSQVRKRGLYVGRFQPFHKGHLEAVKWILTQVAEAVIVVGSAQYSHTPENPFEAGERLTMIRKALDEVGIPRERYEVLPVPDIHTHGVWVEHIVSYVPRFDVVFANDSLTKRLFHEDGRFPVKPIPFYDREKFNATEIRKRIVQGGGWVELLPRTVVDYILEIDGVQRIQDLAKSDKVP